MKRLKKLLLLVFSIVAISCFSFACGGSEGENTNVTVSEGMYYFNYNGYTVNTRFIYIQKNEWINEQGLSGFFSVEGDEVTFTMVDDEYQMVCVYSEGVMSFYDEQLGYYYYCLNGVEPPQEPLISVSGNTSQELSVPSISIPDLSIPDISIPDISIPDTSIPDISIPSISVPTITVPTQSQSVSSSVTSVRVDINFNSNGGKFSQDREELQIKVYKDTLIEAPENPTRYGYLFAGWSKTKSIDNLWNFAQDKVTDGMTLYAVWKEQTAVVLSVEGGTVSETEINILVPYTTEMLSLSSKVVVSQNSYWKLYYDILGTREIPTKMAASTEGALLNGANVFYIVVTSSDNMTTNVYKLTVFRSYPIEVVYTFKGVPIYTDTATAGYEYSPNYILEQQGYIFNYWKLGEQKFIKGILKEPTVLVADYTCRTDTPYKVEHYFQIPGQTGYEIDESLTENLVGTTDSIVTAELKPKDYYVATLNEFTGVVSGDGSTVIKVYYDITFVLNDGMVMGQSPLLSDVENLVIPEQIGGMTITAIADGAFSNSNIKSVTLPNTLLSIGASAFFNCEYISSVTIPNSVTSIGSHAFADCELLDTINYNGDINGWAQISFDSIYANPLKDANLYLNNELFSDSTIVLDTATKISSYAFYYGFSSLSSVTIGNSVTSIESYAFSGCDNLQSLVIGNGVTTLPSGLLSGCSNLQNLVIGNGITTLPSGLLSGCSNLQNLVIGNGVTTLPSGLLSGCSNLQNLVIGNGITTLSKGLLYGCGKLQSITIPFVGGSKNATTASTSTLFGYIFGTSSFTGATAVEQYYASSSYTTYYIPTSLKQVTITGNIIERAFYDCDSLTSVTIGDSVTSIGSLAFKYCSSLTSVTIGDSVTSIGNYAFDSCDSLTSVTIPDSVTSIGYEAFWKCISLTSVTIGDSVTSIGEQAFYWCSSLTSVTIGDSVTSIGEHAFNWCDSLTSVNYLGDINSWAQIEFGSNDANPIYYAKKLYINGEEVTSANITTATKISSYAFHNCDSLTSVTIPDSVTSIGSYAFYNCDSLTSVTIPDSVTSIGSYAFYNCDSLQYNEENGLKYLGNNTNPYLYLAGTTKSITTATINSNCKFIGSYAFRDCTSLTSVTIGDSVISIGNHAFYSCSSLTSVTIPDSVTSIGNYAFSGCDSLTSVTFKNTSGWKAGSTTISSSSLANTSTAATYLKSTYDGRDWRRS